MGTVVKFLLTTELTLVLSACSNTVGTRGTLPKDANESVTNSGSGEQLATSNRESSRGQGNTNIVESGGGAAKKEEPKTETYDDNVIFPQPVMGGAQTIRQPQICGSFMLKKYRSDDDYSCNDTFDLKNFILTQFWYDDTSRLNFTNILYAGTGTRTMGRENGAKLCAAVRPGTWRLPTSDELIDLNQSAITTSLTLSVTTVRWSDLSFWTSSSAPAAMGLSVNL